MNTIDTSNGWADLDPFTRAYVECALWSSTGDDSEPLDRTHGIEDFAPEAIAKAVTYCDAFRDIDGVNLALSEASESKGGHDLWLTQAGHGAGFWDGDYSEGAFLTKKAQGPGSADVVLGADGKLYFE